VLPSIYRCQQMLSHMLLPSCNVGPPATQLGAFQANLQARNQQPADACIALPPRPEPRHLRVCRCVRPQLPRGRPQAPRPDIAARAEAAAASAAEPPPAVPLGTRFAGSGVTLSAGEMPPLASAAEIPCAAGTGAITAEAAVAALSPWCAAVPLAVLEFPLASLEPPAVRSRRPAHGRRCGWELPASIAARRADSTDSASPGAGSQQHMIQQAHGASSVAGATAQLRSRYAQHGRLVDAPFDVCRDRCHA
jgi:hypothetical protein